MVFGVLRKYLSNKFWTTLEELMTLIKDCFKNAPFPVIVNIVTDVLDVKAWLQPDIDPNLSLYSRHGHNNFHPGMHAPRLMKDADQNTICDFRQFQQASFPYVVFKPQELYFWNPSADVDGTQYPCLMNVRSTWERHSILLCVPNVVLLGVAPRKEGILRKQKGRH